MQININRQMFRDIYNIAISADLNGLMVSEESLNWKNQYPCFEKHFLWILDTTSP